MKNFIHWRLYFINSRRVNIKALAGVVITYAIIMMSYVSLSNKYQLTVTSVSVLSNNLVEAIALRASSDRYILLVTIDNSFTDMAINLYEASLRPHHIDNYLFIGIGNSTCEILARQSLACFHYVDDPSAHRISEYGSADFIRKMNIRTDMILETLAANYTVFHSDVDVSFLASPIKEIKVHNFIATYRKTLPP